MQKCLRRWFMPLLALVVLWLDATPAGAQLTQKTLVHAGVTRTWFEHVPASYDGTAAVPLVIVLHGVFSTGDQFAPGSEWTPLADQQNFIVVYPNGGLGSGNSLGWNDFVYDGSAPDDVGFLHQLIQTLEKTYHIDGNRVYMTGFSNGASMTNTFCGNGYTTDLAAIAPCSGDWITTWDLPESLQHPGGPISTWISRGSLEDFVEGDQTHAVQDAAQVAYWVGIDGDSTTPQSVVDGIYTTSIYTGGGGEVWFSTVAGYNHQYGPGFAVKIWGDLFSRIARNAAPAPAPTPAPTPTPTPTPIPTPTPSPTPVTDPTPPPALPVANVTAMAPTASALTGEPAPFAIQLTGEMTRNVTVNFTLGGTAVNGTDYVYRTNHRYITVEHGWTKVTITPPPAVPGAVGRRRVRLLLQPGFGYTVGDSSAAGIGIVEGR